MKKQWLLCGLLLWILSPVYAKPVEIILWHSMAGQLGRDVNQLVDIFNRRQTGYSVKPVYKGDYTECLTSFAAAFRAKRPPALIQVLEVGTTTVLSPEGIIKPVDEIMLPSGWKLPEADFFPAVARYYSRQGQLMAMPFNISVPVMYYNADLLKSFGVSADSFPRTWDEFEQLALKLQKAGHACVYTSAYPAWILVESFLAIHGLPLTNANATAVIGSLPLQHHLERLARWQQSHLFQYGGRQDDATVLFTSGRCPIFSHSSGMYQSFVGLVPFHVGVAPLPLDTQVSSTRHPNVVGGAALWAVAGQDPTVYQGISEFFAYLAEPAVQSRWHQQTGYLPLGLQGVYAPLAHTPDQGILQLAQAELAGTPMTPTAPLGAQHQIRTIYEEALEMIFARMKKPEQALNEAIVRANQALSHFILNTGVIGH